jgi:pyruvate formate lyase activating enzyme
VAMDIKAPPDKYPSLSGISDSSVESVLQSLRYIRDADLPFELRTTVVPGLLQTDDIITIAEWLSAELIGRSDKWLYVLQQFRGHRTLDPRLSHINPYNKAYFDETVTLVKKWLPNVKVRGI